jgi:hypothetical protein
MSKTPIILKKDHSQQKSKTNQSTQPKILIKSNKENVQNVQQATTSAPNLVKKPTTESQSQEPIPPALMKKSIRLMHPHFQISDDLFEFLDNENSDFLVVGIVGRHLVGKTTLINVIANQNYVKISDNRSSLIFQQDEEIFTTKTINYEGATIDAFITSNRIIVLDTSPISANVQRRDMIVSESDDLKLLSILIQSCHLIFAVQDGGFPDLSLERLVNCALEITPKAKKHRAKIMYISNRLEPGTKALLVDNRIHNGIQLSIPDFSKPNVSLHHDIPQVIQEFQEKAFMMKRFSMLNNENEIFTEKKWSERIQNVTDTLKNDYFLRKYDTLRDKYHQSMDS